MWVQVPSLAYCRRRARFLGAALVCVFAAGCATFDEPVTVGPTDRVVARIDGPAASLACAKDRTVAAFAVSTGDGTGITAVDLAEPHATPTSLTSPSKHRRHPPVVLAAGADAATIVWRETPRGSGGLIAWTENAAVGAPYPTVRRLPGEVGSDPRGGGAPPTLIAVEGSPAGRRPTGPQPLGVWQRAADTSDGWERLGQASAGGPLGFAAIGTDAGSAVVGALNSSRELTLARLGTGGPHGAVTALSGRPAGPAGLWLTDASEALLAGWSEWVPGPTGAVAVRLTRSTDAGTSWGPQRTLASSTDGVHPLAHFAADGRTVVATWRAVRGGVERILLSVSTDAAKHFSPPVELDSGKPGTARTRPRVAVRGRRILTAWQEREGAALGIYASLSGDLGSSLTVRAEPIAGAAPGRAPRNPAPWLLTGGRGGVLWESAESRPAQTMLEATKGPQLVTLHHRALRR